MSEEKNSKSHKHSKGRVVSVYVVDSIIFILIALVVVIGVLVAVMPIGTEYVNKAEAAASMQIRDIVLSDELVTFENNEPNIDAVEYGDLVAKITCEDTGVNCNVYYGANRVSQRDGAGMHSSSDLPASGGTTVIFGYDSTYFSAVKYMQKGDTVTLTTSYGSYEYTVSKTKTVDSTDNIGESENSDELILCAEYSDFSNNSGEALVVYAERTGGADNE
ncbi:MAG: sortase [Clostridiales bacterium]|nr:sortase [Clostridiales bacterium]